MAGKSHKAFEVTASRTLVTGRGILTGAQLRAGSDYATLNLRDGTSAAGKLIAVLGAVANAQPDRWNAPSADSGDSGGIAFEQGLYAELAGTAPKAAVYVGAV